MGQLVFQATAGGQVALVGPNPSTNFSLNVPAINGTLITSGDTGTVTSTMLATSVYTAPGTIGSVTPNTGAFTNLSYTGTLTGGTGIVNLGSGQFYKDASGNVGIGTSSSTYKLQVAGSGGNGIVVATSSDASGVTTYMQANTSTAGVFGTLTNHPQTFVTNNTERMRIDSSGNLLVGTTSTFGSANLQIKPTGSNAAIVAQVNTNGNNVVNWYNASASYVSSIVINASTVVYNTVSDYRLKENIAPMTGALDKVKALKPVTYTWKIDGTNGQGFVAHELQSVVPDCVTGEKDAVDAKGNPKYQGIDTSFLVATLTAAIQELNAKVDAQAATITALQAKVGA